MLVLICDDDASARFVMKRLLTQHLGCVVEECADGVAAIARLDAGGVDLLVLDIQMPGLDGVEVLEAVRSTPSLKGLPVIMVSSERRETVIRRLVQLGVDGYILKPLRSEKVLSVLEPLRSKLAGRRRRAPASTTEQCLLGPDSPALLVDGSLDYRHFFLSQTETFGPIVEAGSGAAALARFRESPVRLVFMGGELGVMRAELLVPKLRALAGTAPLRIVALTEGDAPHHGDDQMARTYLPAAFRAAFSRFVEAPSAVRSVTAKLGDPSSAIESAARQVFGMMLDVELAAAPIPASLDGALGASADITLAEGPAFSVAAIADAPSWATIVSRMLAVEADTVQDEDRLSAASELVNLLSGRLDAVINERGASCECSLPRRESDAAAWLTEDAGTHRIRHAFRLAETEALICLALAIGL